MSSTEDLIRLLASEVVAGAKAASLTITRLGDPGVITKDHEAVAIADGVAVTLADVLDRPPQIIRAPAGALSWMGVTIRRELPVRIFAGRDWSGLLALLYDPASKLDGAVTKTSLDGPLGRVAAARRQLGEDAGPVVAGGSVVAARRPATRSQLARSGHRAERHAPPIAGPRPTARPLSAANSAWPRRNETEA